MLHAKIYISKHAETKRERHKKVETNKDTWTHPDNVIKSPGVLDGAAEI